MSSHEHLGANVESLPGVWPGAGLDVGLHPRVDRRGRGGPGEVDACNVVAEISTKSGGDRLRNFNGSEVDRSLSDTVVDQGRRCDRLRRPAQ